jgi:xanthine dehydrogenase accessory factor
MILEQLGQEGFDSSRIGSLHAPIGLDIGAETPAEIAIAILAELVAVRRGADMLIGLNAARAGRGL